MKKNRVKRLLPLFSAASLTAILSIPLNAADWENGDGGEWSEGSNWTGGNVPSPTQTANFPWLDGTTDPINIQIGSDVSVRTINTGMGTDIIFNMGSGTTLTTDSSWRVGNSAIGTGTGPSKLTITGPDSGTGIVNLTTGPASGQIFILGGSSLILTGSNLQVSSPSTTTLYVYGVSTQHNNSLQILQGAQFKQAGLRVGQVTPGNENSTGNHVLVQSGGLLEVNGLSRIGDNSGHNRNYIHVTGTNSQYTSTGDITVGNNNGSNHGGNYILVEDGAKFVNTANLNILGYTVDSTDHGSNRVTIGNTGTFTSSGIITLGHNTATTYANALLQLAAGGVLDGNTTIRVNNGSRFEAAGGGLGTDAITEIRAGGTLAVGLTGESTASQLAVQSAMNFQAGSILELAFYADESHDLIEVIGSGSINGDVALSVDTAQAVLHAGNIFTLFTGNTSSITANFNLDNLDSQLWDTSRFNEAGGWELVVIPEPSTLLLIFSLPLFIGRLFILRIRHQNSRD